MQRSCPGQRLKRSYAVRHLLSRYLDCRWPPKSCMFTRSICLQATTGSGHSFLEAVMSCCRSCRQSWSSGWVSNNTFLVGYGAAQAIPGPLFTFAALLGAVSKGTSSGPGGAALATVAIFLPSFLLVGAALPLWGKLRGFSAMRHAMAAINAAVVGILLSALYDPVWTSAVHSATDFAIALAALLLLTSRRWPSWAVVLVTVAATSLI